MLRRTKKNLEYLEIGKKIITEQFLFAIGCYIGNDGYLLDQTTGLRYNCNGRWIRTRSFGNTIIHTGDIELDIFNYKIVSIIFNQELNRISSEDGIYFRLYQEERKQDGDYIRSAIVLKSSESDYISNYYLNESYKYIDILFRICGMIPQIDLLSQYDLEDYRRDKQ